jgi:hypothetical protein
MESAPVTRTLLLKAEAALPIATLAFETLPPLLIVRMLRCPAFPIVSPDLFAQ